ncbi:SPFH domain-containing protein [Bernardetia sp.]|uniref:SPFH domain-containing protein n=1 Tax=Bernardetia sp. TaxID=1937974 RepID=UPI0025B891B1|nr:SPFH domain-containing protein [Bernardetia sp.]
MGFWDKISGQFIDVIEWIDNSRDTIVYRFNREGNEIKYGAQLTVREGQQAVFINEGQLADVFPPGRYELSTQNMPILTTLKSWKYGFNSPFKAEVYFVNMRPFYDNKWGTRNPIRVRDPELGSMGVEIRAFGSFAFKVIEPSRFLIDIVGTDGHFTTEEITNKLKGLVVKQFTDGLGESKIPFLDLAANYEELGAMIKKKLVLDFDRYGVDITDFVVENMSLPDHVQKVLDQRNEMEIMGRSMQGNLNNYTQFKMGQAMEDAANNPSGGNDGLSMGMGMAMANQMSNQMQQQNNQGQQQNPPSTPPPMVAFHVYVNGEQKGPFPMGEIKRMVESGELTRTSYVWKNGMAEWTEAGKVTELQTLFSSVPPPPPPM